MSLIEEVVKRVEELARRVSAIETRLELQDTLSLAGAQTTDRRLAAIEGETHVVVGKLNTIIEMLNRLQA